MIVIDRSRSFIVKLLKLTYSTVWHWLFAIWSVENCYLNIAHTKNEQQIHVPAAVSIFMCKTRCSIPSSTQVRCTQIEYPFLYDPGLRSTSFSKYWAAPRVHKKLTYLLTLHKMWVEYRARKKVHRLSKMLLNTYVYPIKSKKLGICKIKQIIHTPTHTGIAFRFVKISKYLWK